MPDEGAWRIYTLSALARGMDPDYEHIWAQLFDDPEALEVVAFTKDASGPARAAVHEHRVHGAESVPPLAGDGAHVG